MNGPLGSFDLWVGLFGGLALFLFGMDIMTVALKRAAGDYMKDILAKLTSNRLVGAGLGAVVTAVIQSSSVTTVILVGFISAGLMSMAQSVAVIMGANIGTTITAQILAFKVTKLALPMIAIGFLASFISKNEVRRELGNILLGLGLVFYGMGVMSGAMKPLRSYEPFIDFMISLDNALLGAMVGAAFTAIVQSSSATTGILIVMAGQGLISLEGAIAIALGANIGTCVTAGLASIGKPREAVRAAAVHTLFNVAGVLLWIGFVPQLAQLASSISPASTELIGIERLAADSPRQIANAHTLFNVINTFLFIGLSTQIARLVEWLIPDRPIVVGEEFLPKFLDVGLISTPAIALDAVRREIGRIGGQVQEMIEAVMPVAISGTRAQLEKIAQMDKVVDALHRAVIGYLREISLTNLSESQSRRLMTLIQIANDLEHIGDQIATNMITSAGKRIDEGVVVSEATANAITGFHQEVVKALEGALEAVAKEDQAIATQVRGMKKDVADLGREIAAHGIERLTADAPLRLETYAREMEMIEILDAIFKVARRIARSQLQSGQATDEAMVETV
ncbi:MAG: Na/Pi cotransporter family protein [Paracoccaceae bacterium]|nr:Na/Pi cotransporter family protein [Paracoccaceae bacterium]